jgi:hypothetical protein
MKIDLNVYKNNATTIKSYLIRNKHLSFLDKISNRTLMTSLPLIVSVFYVIKYEGDSVEARQQIEKLIVFYKYDAVLNEEEFLKP